MSPAARNLSIYRGDDYRHVITFVDGNNAPLSLTNYTEIAAQARVDSADTTPDVFTIDETDKATGVLVLTLAGAVTAELPTASRWDLEWVTPEGVRQTVLAGRVTAEGQVTVP